MQFYALVMAAVSLGSVLAQNSQVTVHVVRVGSSDNALTYSPNRVTAAVGDMVQFQFASGNHTATQSTFDKPCEPASKTDATQKGIFSGFMPVAAAGASSSTPTMMPTYTIMINSTAPLWIYCSQGKHCQKGMNMVINENVVKNSTRNLETYMALAAKSAATYTDIMAPKPVGAYPPSPTGKFSVSSPSGLPIAGGPRNGAGGGKSGGVGPGNGSGKDSGPLEIDPKNPFASSGEQMAKVAISLLIGLPVLVLTL